MAARSSVVLSRGVVAITGASGQVGNALRRRLAALSVETRPLARADDWAAAFRDAFAVVHLAGALRPDRQSSIADANEGTVARAVSALAGSSVERLVYLSYVGAEPGSTNGYLRAKAAAERALRSSGRDVVVFRCTHVFGPPDDPGPTVSALLADPSASSGSVRILGDGTQRVAPVYREDVVDAIVAALDPATYHGRFDLPGPERLSLDDLVRLVNGRPVRLRHVPVAVARLLGRVHPGLTPELVDVLLADSLGDGLRVDRAFGLERRPVSEVYRPTVALAA